MGYTELSLNDAQENSLLYANLKGVLAAGNRAKNLVKQILAFSRQSAPGSQPVSVRYLLKESMHMLRASIPTTIRIEQKIESNAIVESDPTRIHQIIMNLCTNAAHAMAENGGTLEISLIDREILPKDELTKKIKPGPYLMLSVSDTGHGMTPEVKDRIFEPFFTTKEQGQGTGMGLSVIHGIIESQGGCIEVYSEPGQGSRFNIYLPSIVREIVKDPLPKKEIPMGSERILFVDDEEMLIRLTRQMLEALGYHVTTRSSSIEALELFKAKPDSFDLVITDLTMPNMTGIGLATEMRKIRPDIKVVIATGYSEQYYNAMACAANFAWANRQILMDNAQNVLMKTLGIGPRDLGMHLVYDVCHNMAKIETHEINGKKRQVCVHRKGATRALPPGDGHLCDTYRPVGQPILIPGDMGTASYVLAGTKKAMDDTFGSTCHGAGRILSRKAAKKAAKGRALHRELNDKGILVRWRGRSTMAEEMPEAYKNISDVVDVVHGSGISKKVAKLKPIAVIKG